MNPSQLEALSLLLQAVNVLVVPALAFVARYLWAVERRLIRLELAPYMARRPHDDDPADPSPR